MSTATQSAVETSAPQQGPVRARRRLSRPVLVGLYLAGIALGAALSAVTDFAVTSTIVYGVVLRPLPFGEPDRLISVWGRRLVCWGVFFFCWVSYCSCWWWVLVAV